MKNKIEQQENSTKKGKKHLIVTYGCQMNSVRCIFYP